ATGGGAGSSSAGAGGSMSGSAAGANGGAAPANAGAGVGGSGAGTGGAGASGGTGAAGLGAAAGSGGRLDDNGGRGGTAGASAGGAASTADCSGAFGSPQVLVAGAKQVILSSPTVPDDGLELFFVEHDLAQGGAPRIMRATQGAMFGDGAPVAELDSVCASTDERGISLTGDGLRLYVDCYMGTSTFTPGLVHVARRASRNASFTIDSATYGTVGPQIDVTPDELTAFTSSEMNTTSPPRQYSRSSASDPFAMGQAVPGLESVALGTPFLAADGLTLYGGVDPDLVFASRPAPGEPFGATSPVFSGTKSTVSYKAPELSADCRTLYFVRIDTSGGASTYSLEVATR
ncbi:MAG TPA: hypothetical protein VMI54_00925, partial [Polyangiaceae bacterium]|nr:hypothetical protein [Polyangiaceae bacterium]